MKQCRTAEKGFLAISVVAFIVLGSVLEGIPAIVLTPERVYRYRRHDATMTAQNSRSLVRLDEEVAVSRQDSAAARALGWARSARAAELRLTVRLNGALESARLVLHRQFRAGLGAARQAVSR